MARVLPLGLETVCLSEARGRVLAADLLSTVDVPPFPRSAVDGFALDRSLLAATALGRPVDVPIACDVYPGDHPDRALPPGHAARIRTGAPLPAGADTVVRLEVVEDRGAIARFSTPPPVEGRDVSPRGDDVRAGDVVLAGGRVVRAADVGLAASLGLRSLVVRRRPRVVILSTGSELVDARGPERARPGAIYDSNGPMLAALAEDEGALVTRPPIVRDDRARLRAALETLDADVSISSGAASVGSEDVIPELVRELGELWVHGVAMRPGHPVGFGRIGERIHFVLPGNPVAAWAAFRLFVRPALRLLAGLPRHRAFEADRRARAHLASPVASARGRTDVVRVRWGADGTVEPLGAQGASRLTTLTRADGFFLIPPQVESVEAGTEIDLELL